jgi:hypothetical protein
MTGGFQSVVLPTFNGLTFTVVQSLNAISLQVIPSVGDFNHDGFVDAADYTVWRDGLGSRYTLADYDTWRAHFGQSVGSGAGASGNAAAPEPSTYILLLGILAMSSFTARQHRKLA